MLIITGLYEGRYVFENLGYTFENAIDLFDYYFLAGISLLLVTLLYTLSNVSLIVGAVGTGVILLTNKATNFLKTTPYLIGVSYILTLAANVIGMFRWPNGWYISGALEALLIGGIWLYAASLNSKKQPVKSNKQVLMLVGTAVACLTGIIGSIMYGYGFFEILISVMVCIILAAFIVIQLANDSAEISVENANIEAENFNMNENNTNYSVPNKTNTQIMPEDYVEVWKVVVFSIITLGIYFFIWIYRTVGFLNKKVLGEEQSQGIQVVLCLLVPFYILYWLYKQSKLIDQYTMRVGYRSNDLSIISLVLGVFGFSIIAIALMQDQINKNLLKEAGISTQAYPYQDPTVRPSTEVPTQMATEQKTEGTYEMKRAPQQTEPAHSGINGSDIELLKKLKELMDAGILTEEEFEAEKKKILNK